MKNLPYHIREVVRISLGPRFFAYEVEGACSIIAKLPEGCIKYFRRKYPMTFQSQLGTFPSGAVLRLVIGIHDRPEIPFEIEVFLGMPEVPRWVIESGFRDHDPRTVPNTLRLAEQLTRQSTLPIHLAEFDGTYARVSHKPKLTKLQRKDLASQVARARIYNLNTEHFDFDEARSVMEKARQRRRPSEAWLKDGYPNDYLRPWECTA